MRTTNRLGSQKDFTTTSNLASFYRLLSQVCTFRETVGTRTYVGWGKCPLKKKIILYYSKVCPKYLLTQSLIYSVESV